MNPDPPPTGSLLVKCAWCGTTLRTLAASNTDARDRVSHGVCVDCLGGLLDIPLTDIYGLTEAEVDDLPFGVIGLDRHGIVRMYNAFEMELSRLQRESVIGDNFFTQVAPCTRDTIVEETFRSLLAAGGGDADLEFVFRFTSGHRLVRIRMIVDPAKETQLLMVRDRSAEAMASTD